MKFLLGFLGIILLFWTLKIILQPVDTLKKGVNLTYDVTEKTLDADKAIYNYEWFKNQEQQIKVLGKQLDRASQEFNDFIEAQSKDRIKWDMFDKNEYARLKSNITGIGQMLDAAIGDYNAKSSMVNRAIFKDNLPTNIQRGFYTSIELIKQ